MTIEQIFCAVVLVLTLSLFAYMTHKSVKAHMEERFDNQRNR